MTSASTSSSPPPQIRRAAKHIGVVSQRFDGVTVVVQLETSRIHELNSTAGRFWELLEPDGDFDRIVAALKREFDVSESQLRDEVQSLAAQLAAEQLITILERA